MHVAIVTAGGAGMFCGSCMHDNTWARALLAAGHEVSLIPTYTPLQLDEEDRSLQRVFFGGLNVYLNAQFPWWRRVPRRLTTLLDRPGLIRWATKLSVSNDARELGALTLSMVRGEQGPHQAAIGELATFLQQLCPDVVVFSNALLVGALRGIRERCPAPVYCLLQGDDVFLDALTPEFREPVVAEMHERALEFTGYLTHTRFYQDYMAKYLSLPDERFQQIPLGIDLSEHTGRPRVSEHGALTVGYFARVAPEKGLHHLVDALLLLQRRLPNVRLRLGGYQAAQHHAYRDALLQRLRAANIPYENIGSPALLSDKVAFFESIDVFSTPTEFLEPKGMPVLEALANGVPVVQPAHGAYPEMLAATGGGILVRPRDPQALADGLEQLADPDRRRELAERGWLGVREQYSLERLVEKSLKVFANGRRATPSPNPFTPA